MKTRGRTQIQMQAGLFGYKVFCCFLFFFFSCPIHRPTLFVTQQRHGADGFGGSRDTSRCFCTDVNISRCEQGMGVPVSEGRV